MLTRDRRRNSATRLATTSSRPWVGGSCTSHGMTSSTGWITSSGVSNGNCSPSSCSPKHSRRRFTCDGRDGGSEGQYAHRAPARQTRPGQLCSGMFGIDISRDKVRCAPRETLARPSPTGSAPQRQSSRSRRNLSSSAARASPDGRSSGAMGFSSERSSERDSSSWTYAWTSSSVATISATRSS